MRINKGSIKRTEEWLDERLVIAKMDDARPQDMSFYNGALEAIEFLGFNWNKKDGKHTIY